MAVTAEQVKQLRDRTNAPMMECKKFLQMTDGDIELAIEKMRESGATKAAKKEGRITAEGMVRVAVSADKKMGVIVEINSETDFVSRSEDFKQFADQVVKVALAAKTKDLPALLAAKYGDDTVEVARQNLIAKLGENINIRRVTLLESTGAVAAYSHGERIGVLVSYQGDEQLGKDLAMHIAASNPQVVNPEDVSQELIEKEKKIYLVQAAESGKPQDIIDKMVAGRINKFLAEVSLAGQPFVKDPDITVGKLLTKSNGKVNSFTRYEVGEGIEKKVDNFAEEVMAQVRGG